MAGGLAAHRESKGYIVEGLGAQLHIVVGKAAHREKTLHILRKLAAHRESESCTSLEDVPHSEKADCTVEIMGRMTAVKISAVLIL